MNIVPVPGYEELGASDDGTIWRLVQPKWSLRPVPYPLVPICRCNDNIHYCVNYYSEGRHQTVYIHTLIALTFLGPQRQGYEVHHKDENPANNAASNLEWIEKIRHTQLHCSPLDENDIRAIRASNLSNTAVASEYGVHNSTISRIRNRLHWANVA